MIKEPIIFWDWNGTLLDDASICLSSMNSMMGRRNMPKLSLERYREVFGFPVQDYYEKIGFDFSIESFEQLSVEFIDNYQAALKDVGLVAGAENVLDYYTDAGKQNVIVSAMKQDMLLESVKHNRFEKYFSEIIGIDDIYAASKSQLAVDYVKRSQSDPQQIVFVGDTTHDYEVACDIGCRCILVADGHQSRARLEATGAEVVESLSDLLQQRL